MKPVKIVATSIFLIFCVTFVTGINAATVAIHTNFNAGDTLTADDLNNRMRAIPDAINTNDTDIGNNTSAISTNGTAISVNSTASSNNGTSISTNTSAISSNTSRSTSNDTKIKNLTAQPSCASDSFVQSITVDGLLNCVIPATGGNGDITEVNTSTGLTGGQVSGPVTLGIDPLVVQKRFTRECPVGEYVRGVNVNGNPVCIPDDDSLGNLTTCGAQQIAKNIAGTWQCADDVNTDSAGVAFAAVAGEIPITASPIALQQVTLTAPGPGVVIVSFSAFYRMLHSTGADQLQIGIADSATATISTLLSRRFLFLSSGYPAGEFYASVASHAVFTVTAAGTYTYYVLGVSNKTAPSTIGVSNPATQAIFVPNNY